jgi:predicted metal-dependent hydrolase
VVQALLEKADWIERKLLEMGERQQQLGASKIVWRDRTEFDCLGGQLRVVLDSSAVLKKGSVQLELLGAEPGDASRGLLGLLAKHEGEAGQAGERGRTGEVGHAQVMGTLRVGLPHHADPVQIREAVQAWLMKQARELFAQRLNTFAPRLGVSWRRLSVSSAQTRWGSASADGSIRLNWRLIHYKLDVIDYVVVHELSHLREMNHSPRFWATVHSVMPDYEVHKRVLREQTLAPWD